MDVVFEICCTTSVSKKLCILTNHICSDKEVPNILLKRFNTELAQTLICDETLSLKSKILLEFSVINQAE